MRYQGINANIMSLGGIAIAIGAMVDAAIVMIENAHKHLERAGPAISTEERWVIVRRASEEVGPALFYSLLIITLSFLPVFTLQAQEGRLFSPLAYTKTYAMAAAAGLSVTLVPVLMGYFIRGRIPPRDEQSPEPLPDLVYRPLLGAVLAFPRTTLVVALLAMASLLLPVYGVGGAAGAAEVAAAAVAARRPGSRRHGGRADRGMAGRDVRGLDTGIRRRAGARGASGGGSARSSCRSCSRAT